MLEAKARLRQKCYKIVALKISIAKIVLEKATETRKKIVM